MGEAGMLLALNIKTVVLAAALAASPMAVSIVAPADAVRRQPTIEAPALVALKPGRVSYFAAGEFTRHGKPANAPAAAIQIDRPVAMMKNLVSVGEYQRCVADGACVKLAPEAAAAPDRPVTMVSWRDARAYALWLSRKLDARYRLPTDEEWTVAAGSRAPDESPPAGDGSDPVARWLARYARESESRPDPAPLPVGSFGANEHGLADMSGNVWEWTDSCFTRSALDDGSARVVTINCGVRVVEGRHRTYVSDFIRDARAGGCAVGVPPSNLGFRLVRDAAPEWWISLAKWVRRVAG
jgi:formylglycine-generating enzyme required for sulfatase activity